MPWEQMPKKERSPLTPRGKAPVLRVERPPKPPKPPRPPDLAGYSWRWRK